MDDFKSKNESVLSIDDLYGKASFLNSITELIYNYLKISNVVDENLSSYQKNMIIALHRLKMSIDDSKLQRIIEMAIKESETMKRKKIVNIKSEKMDKHIKRIQHNVESIVMRIDDFLLKRGGIFKHAINFFFNDTFGSLKQLKCELISRFDAEDFNIEINSSLKNPILS